MSGFLSRLTRRRGRACQAAPPPQPSPDLIAERLKAAVAAEVQATACGVETYEARVNAMIQDFFSRLEDPNARRPS